MRLVKQNIIAISLIENGFESNLTKIEEKFNRVKHNMAILHKTQQPFKTILTLFRSWILFKDCALIWERLRSQILIRKEKLQIFTMKSNFNQSKSIR